MPISVPNPYTGKDDQTCSVSVGMQQDYLGGPDVSNQQTEAEYNTSKQLGEWGVIKAKYLKNELYQGQKILTFVHPKTGTTGYLYYKDKKIYRRFYQKDGTYIEKETNFATGELIIKAEDYKTSIPGSVGKEKEHTQPGDLFVGKKDHDEWGAYQTVVPKTEPQWTTLKEAGLNKPGQEFILMGEKLKEKKAAGVHVVVEVGKGYPANANSLHLVEKNSGELISAQAASTAKFWVSPTGSGKIDLSPKPTAAPTPSPAVSTGSPSLGSMSHEDVAAMFVKIKDDLAKEQGLNIKGANPGLDEVVYKAIGEKTGYTAAEVKAKIDAYKADGNKLSALKKKVMNGSKKVPEGKAQPAKQTAPSSPLAAPASKATKPDPAPNGVPTVATPKLADTIKADVKATVAAAAKKVYSDEDASAAYIIAKDKIVAESNGKWTLYSKNDELDKLIYDSIEAQTGLTKLEVQGKVANYLASGKKLSALKKQLAKQGAFSPQADTLKAKSPAAAPKAQTPEEKFAELLAKKKEAEAKADAGYTPTPTPSTAGKAGDPQVDTGKPAPKAVEREAEKSGAIEHITDANQLAIYQAFKSKGNASYLTSTNEQTYESLLAVQATFKANGQDYTLLQLLRVIDHQGAIKFKAENGKLFEKKTAAWLTSPDATVYLKIHEAKLAKLAEQAKLKEEAEKAAKLLEANQPPLPADSATFKEMDPQSSYELGQVMLAKKPFGPGEKTALRHYTGGAYHAMNGHLRGLSQATGTDLDSIAKAIKGFRPSPENILLRRGTGANQFISLGVDRGQANLVWGLTGKTFQDNGFLSTSGAGRAAFGGEVNMEIEAPAGCPMMWVDDFSKHKGENEMLLAPGLKYKILNVRKVNGSLVVRLRVVDWPGKG